MSNKGQGVLNTHELFVIFPCLKKVREEALPPNVVTKSLAEIGGVGLEIYQIPAQTTYIDSIDDVDMNMVFVALEV